MNEMRDQAACTGALFSEAKFFYPCIKTLIAGNMFQAIALEDAAAEEVNKYKCLADHINFELG